MSDEVVGIAARRLVKATRGGGKFRIWDIPWEPPPNRKKTDPGHIYTIMQKFTPIGATVAEISVTKQEVKVI